MKLLNNLLNLRRGFLLDVRIWAFLVPALLILAIDLPVLFTLIYALAAIGLVVGLSHVARRILFPYLDFEVLVDQAERSPTGAAIVFLGSNIVFATIILACAIWMAR